MRKIAVILLSVALTGCIKQPNHQLHYTQKKHAQAHTSLLDFLFTQTKTKKTIRSPDAYTIRGRTYRVLKSANGYRERGSATWYGRNFHHKRTSSGERYNMHALTAAHRTLPLNSYVKVTNLKNGRSVVVRINDRGPFHSNRLIDLSYAAAQGIGLFPAGMAQVEIEVSSPQKIHRPIHKPVVKKTPHRVVRHHTQKKRPAKIKHKVISKPYKKPLRRRAVIKKTPHHRTTRPFSS